MEMFPQDFLINKFKNPVPHGRFVIFNARKCNRSCNFCYIKDMKWGQQSFDQSEIDEVFESHPKGYPLAVGIAGGEPFVDKEAFGEFCRAVTKYADKISTVQIMSNMDFYERVRGQIALLPVQRVSITTNARNRYFFESDDKVHIWNGIFLDEFIGVDKYALGPKYRYAFSLKNPAMFNDLGDEAHYNWDFFEAAEKIKRMYDSGSIITILSTSNWEEYQMKREIFMDPRFLYMEKVNFPSGWKQQYVTHTDTCKSCGKVNEDCKIAIENNICPRLHKECWTCSKQNTCSTVVLNEKIFMKDRMPDCSRMKQVMDLGEYYRTLYKSQLLSNEVFD